MMNVSRNLRKSGKNVAIDEGCIPFKGHVHLKCYNPNKPAKYHIKTFKLCDSSNSCCCKFDLYVGESGVTTSKFGKNL